MIEQLNTTVDKQTAIDYLESVAESYANNPNVSDYTLEIMWQAINDFEKFEGDEIVFKFALSRAVFGAI